MFGIKYLRRIALLVLLSAPAVAQVDANDGEAGPLDQVVPVAEDGEPSSADTAPDTPDDQPLTEERILEEFARYQRLLAEKAMDEADVSAKRVVEMAIRFYGPRSRETAKALNNLAVVQHSQGQYEAAIQNFTASIDIIENLENRLSDQLVNPLKGLGAAELGNGRPDLAIRAFDRATHITHVNEGPHNLDQVELLESLAESNMRLGNLDEARDILERIHVLNVRHFADNEMGLLPSLSRRAEWQKNAGYYNDARTTYRRILRIIEDHSGRDDQRLIDPLVALGQTFYFIDPSPESANSRSLTISGETYFKRAVRIADETADYPWLNLATTKLALADYYTFAGSPNRSHRIYREVWDFLSGDEDRLQARKELLERPVVVRQNPLPKYIGRGSGAFGGAPDGDYLRGQVRVEYTVSPRGSVRKIRSEVAPREFVDMLSVVHREVRTRVFRPMHMDGEPVQSPEQVFEHEFYYQDTDLERAREELATSGRLEEETEDDEEEDEEEERDSE